MSALNSLDVVYRLEQVYGGPSVFLAGPTPRTSTVASWRPDALRLAAKLWSQTDGAGRLTVVTPEPSVGVLASDSDAELDWEVQARAAADVVAYWVPRDVTTLPGFVTNVEFGWDVATRSESVVLGSPPGCPSAERNRYLEFLARRHGVPVLPTLTQTLRAALRLLVETS